MFDSSKKGSIEKEKVRTILNTLGQSYDDKELENLLKEQDPQGINNNNKKKTKAHQRKYTVTRPLVPFDVVVVHRFYYRAPARPCFWTGANEKSGEMISTCQFVGVTVCSCFGLLAKGSVARRFDLRNLINFLMVLDFFAAIGPSTDC